MKKTSIILFLLTCLCFNGCGDIELNSLWREQNITIDGNDSDWGDSLKPLDKIDASAGMVNDNNYLYLCLSTNDPEVVNKILAGGLTLWFKGNENSDDKFGIHYPMGLGDSSMPMFSQNMKPGDKPVNFSKMQENILKKQTELEIINTDNSKVRIPVSELQDIQLKAEFDKGKLVYEMKIPLNQKNSTTYALNAHPGGTVRIGIESGNTGQGNRNNYMPSGEFGMPTGGDDGPGGYPDMPGTGGYPPGGMQRMMFASEPFDFWINVKLAVEK